MGKIAKHDWHLVPIEPDANFDPEHNKKVIEDTIRKSQIIAARKKREWENKARERTAAVAQYVKAIDTGNTEKSVLDYFGRKELARLRGEEIMQSIIAEFSNAKKKEINKKAKLYAAQSR